MRRTFIAELRDLRAPVETDDRGPPSPTAMALRMGAVLLVGLAIGLVTELAFHVWGG